MLLGLNMYSEWLLLGHYFKSLDGKKGTSGGRLQRVYLHDCIIFIFYNNKHGELKLKSRVYIAINGKDRTDTVYTYINSLYKKV